MFTPLDDPKEALNHLADPLRSVRDCLDDGISWADTTMEGHPPDPYLWSHLARYRARNLLGASAAGHWSMGRNLANSGIEILCNPLIVRVLKTQGSTTPHPGRNRARRKYWSQIPTQIRLPLIFGGKPMPQQPNLIVDWTVGSDKEILLALAKPRGVWKYRGNPKLEWRRAVSFGAADEPKFVPSEEDVDVDYDRDELKGEGEA